MTPTDSTRGSTESRIGRWSALAPRVFTLLLLLYGFLVSIGMLGKAFKMFSGGLGTLTDDE